MGEFPKLGKIRLAQLKAHQKGLRLAHHTGARWGGIPPTRGAVYRVPLAEVSGRRGAWRGFVQNYKYDCL